MAWSTSRRRFTAIPGLRRRTATPTDPALRARSARSRALRHAARNPATVVGLAFVLLLILMALMADLFPLDDPNAMDVTARRAAIGRLLAAAAARGQARADLDTDLVIDLLVGPLWILSRALSLVGMAPSARREGAE